MKKFLLPLLAMAFAVMACGKTEPNEEEPTPDNPNPPVVSVLPEDPNPDQYTDFFRRNILLDHTGTLCGYCPFMHRMIVKMEENLDKEGQVIPVYSHSYTSSDPMYNLTAMRFKGQMGITSYPSANMDFRKDRISYDYDATSGSQSLWRTATKLAEQYPAKVNLSAATKVSDKTITVTVGIKVAEAGEYRINALLLEDGIKASQTNNGAPTDVDYNTHNNALRSALNDKIDGNELEALAAGQTHEKTLTLAVPASVKKIENCKVVIYVMAPDKAGSSNVYLNNAVLCPVNGTAPFKYKN